MRGVHLGVWWTPSSAARRRESSWDGRSLTIAFRSRESKHLMVTGDNHQSRRLVIPWLSHFFGLKHYTKLRACLGRF